MSTTNIMLINWLIGLVLFGLPTLFLSKEDDDFKNTMERLSFLLGDAGAVILLVMVIAVMANMWLPAVVYHGIYGGSDE